MGRRNPLKRLDSRKEKKLGFFFRRLGFFFPKAWIFLPPAWIFLPRCTQKENLSGPTELDEQ